MPRPGPINRRLAILGGLALAPTAYLGAFGVGAARPCSVALAFNADTVRKAEKVGRAVLTAHVLPTDLQHLRYSRNLDDDAFLAFVQRETETLADRAQRDFEVGDLVTCDGWVLSRSEAMMCAHLTYRSLRRKTV